MRHDLCEVGPIGFPRLAEMRPAIRTGKRLE
jgi:hypothetical protein